MGELVKTEKVKQKQKSDNDANATNQGEDNTQPHEDRQVDAHKALGNGRLLLTPMLKRQRRKRSVMSLGRPSIFLRPNWAQGRDSMTLRTV